MKRFAFDLGQNYEIKGLIEDEEGSFVKHADHLAALPKVWDAETIREAPEGVYMVEWSNEKAHKPPQWEKASYRSLEVITTFLERGMYTRAFGPIPQPPEQP